MLPLSEIKFYNVLNERTSAHAKAYSGIIHPIVTDANDLLSYIKKLYPEFPDHGLQHSFRILNYIAYILTDDEIEALTDTEIFCLILAALFHDTGMTLIESSETSNLRQDHHNKSEVVIDKYFDEKLRLINNVDRIKKAVLFACKGHGRLLDELYKDKQFEIIDNISFDKVRYSVLAVLLRIGDLMDFENMRSNKFVISLFKNTYTKEALDHNIRSHKIEYYNYTPNEIKVEVTADNITQHKIWLSWFTFLHDDILRANTYLKEFHFPILDYKITKANGVEYNVQELRFEIDEKGGIWDIISQSIYTDKLDFLRELIQNAIDASLMEIYNTSSIVIDFKSPRSWNASKYNKNVIVGYSEKSNQLYVIDYGTGMSELDLRNFLFRVSGSGRANSHIRDFDFPAIAKYGIGFISCLVNAESINIYTRKLDDNEMHYVSLESNSNLAFMENIESEKFSGTAILLDLKNKFTFLEIKNYIENTFKYASVGIYCINVDAISELSEVFQMSAEFDMLSSKPYILNELCSRLVEKREKITEPILQKTKTLGKLCTDVENLITWVDDHKEYDVNYSDKKKLKDFKKQVSEISAFIESNNLEHKFPIRTDEVNEKRLLTTREYTPQIENYYSKLMAKFKETTQEVNKYPFLRNLVHNLRLYAHSDNKYIIAFIDENLQISKVVCTNEIIDLSNKTGIVILNHQATDYNSGYEYSCINAFLFHNGEICNSIAKFNGKKLIYSIGSWKNDIIVGSYYDYDEAWYGLEEDISNQDFWESDYRYESDDFYEDMYDVIYIENNKFMFNDGVPSVKSNLYHNGNEEKHHTNFVNSIIDIYTKNEVDNDNAVLFQAITCHLESEYYQDGIKIPFNLENLIPFGYFKITCNCTTDSRMALNVTRHKASEIPQDIDNWMISAGEKIQNSIMKSIKDMLDALHLTIDFKKLKQRYSNNYLANLCLKNIHEINDSSC